MQLPQCTGEVGNFASV